MIWQLVQSSWILHVSCNKRRVAAIGALLSSVLHPSFFSDETMHMINGASGPLKWVRSLSLSFFFVFALVICVIIIIMKLCCYFIYHRRIDNGIIFQLVICQIERNYTFTPNKQRVTRFRSSKKRVGKAN